MARVPVSLIALAAAATVWGCGAPPRQGAGPRAQVAVRPEAPPPAPAPRREAAPRVGWAIQVGAFADVANAERLAAHLERAGVDAFYFRRESGLFTVRFGDYPTRAAAESEARRLQEEGTVTEWFVTPPAAPARRAPVDPRAPSAPPPRGDDLGAVAARTAERFVGIPYRWGGNNVVEGMDCSGFVRAVYHLVGVALPRTAAEQFRGGAPVERRNLRDGDLVFFGDGGRITHVGLYAGDGRFVHAPSRGQDIKTSSLDEPYFARVWAGGRRYL
jgi:cell wall-associated NlpC family hydrolase